LFFLEVLLSRPVREVPGTPSIGWRDAAIGGGLGVIVALIAGVGIASVVAVCAGGFLAARSAGHHGLLQGAAAAAVFIVVIGLVDTFALQAQTPIDTVRLVAVDAVHLLAGALGGWLALRS
jgi:putative membrane protein (TIGR04086 family)